MRSSYPTLTRDAYLSGTITPEASVVIRQTRLDFGDELFHYNTAGVTGATAGDDYYDVDGHHIVWGDACANPASPGSTFRLTAKAAWTAAGSNVVYRSYSVPGSDSWAMTQFTGPDTLDGYSRLGVRPVAGSLAWYVWYVDSAQSIKRVQLSSGWAWSGKTGGASIGGFSAAAVHPVSDSEAIVVYYEDPCLRLRYIKYTGSWTIGAEWPCWMSDELVWSDVHWSDAEYIPGENKIVVAVNLNKWGSAHYVIYDVTSGVWSQPREMLPSCETWGNLRAWVPGLSVIDSRLWAVTIREPVASNNLPMARHVALMSSLDGKNWVDEGFVTTSEVRGKLCYVQDNTYAHVVGSVSVARAEATNRLGYDAPDLKYTLPISGLQISHAGAGSAPEITVKTVNSDDPNPYAALAQAGNELSVEIGAEGFTSGLLQTGVLNKPKTLRAVGQDMTEFHALGRMSRVVGSASYRPVAAKNYAEPYVLDSNFQLDGGSPRMTLRSFSGRWKAVKDWEVGHHVLKCERPGVAIVPHGFNSQHLQMRVAFKPEVSVEGFYILFWWEKDGNLEEGNRYWRAGVYNDSGTHKLEIRRCWDGELGDALDSDAVSVSAGNWYTLFLDIRADRVRAWLNNDEYDFSSDLGSVSYSVLDGDLALGPPVSYHAGVEVAHFSGWTGADMSGTVDDATDNTLVDTSANFTDALIGDYVRCRDQDRLIGMVDDAKHELWVAPPWADKPIEGDEYGVYSTSTLEGPQARLKELFVSEGIVPWTVDEIAADILALSGVDRGDIYSQSVGTISSAVLMDDVDLVITSSASTTSAYIWTSTKETSGSSAFSGFTVEVGEQWTALYQHQSLYGGGNSSTLIAKHPNLKWVPTGVAKDIRIQANDRYLVVSVEGHFVTAFPMTGCVASGYVSRVDGSSGSTSEFRTLFDFIWDANTPASSAIHSLMRGRRAKLIEREDGTVAISRFDSPLGDLGEYVDPVIQLQTAERHDFMIGLHEVVGQVETAFHLDETAARRSLRYRRDDNPTLRTQPQAHAEAIQTAVLDQQQASTAIVELYAPDPAAELEDQFTVDGSDYIVDGMSLSLIESKDGPHFKVEILARAAPTAADIGEWGTDYYDKGKEYG